MLRNGFVSVYLILQGYAGFSQEKPELVVTTGHHAPISTLAYSPDGKYLVSGGDDNVVKIIDLGLKQEFNSMPGHSGSINRVQFSSNGKYVFSLSKKEAITWEFPSCKLLKRTLISGDNDGYGYDAFISGTGILYWPCNSDGLYVYDLMKGEQKTYNEELKLENVAFIESKNQLCGKLSNDGEGVDLVFVDATTLAITSRIKTAGFGTAAIAVSKNGKWIATEEESGKILIANAQTMAKVTTLNAGAQGIICMEFDADGKNLAVTSRDNTLRIFTTADGKKTLERTGFDTEPASTFNIILNLSPLAFSPDKKTIALGYQMITSFKGTFRIGLFDAVSLQRKDVFDGAAKTCLSLFTDADETRLVVGNVAAPVGVRIWNLKKGELEQFHKGSVYAEAEQGKLNLLYFDGSDKRIRVFDFKDMKSLLDIPVQGTMDLVASADGKYVAGVEVSTDKTGMPLYNLYTWNPADGKKSANVKYTVTTFPKYIDFTPENKLMVVFPERLELMNPANGKIESTTQINSSEFPLNGDYEFLNAKEILYATTDDTNTILKSCDIISGDVALVAVLPFKGSPKQVEFNASKTQLAVALIDPNDTKPFKVAVFSWPDKKLLCELKEHSAFVTRVCFGPKTSNLYTADNNGVVSVWNLNDCIKKSSFLSMNEKDFMIVSPDNYYRSSASNLNGVGFRYKGKLYRFDQFDMIYNRPDVVLGQLGFAEASQLALYKDAYKKRLKRMGFTEDRISVNKLKAPDLAIEKINELPTAVATENFSFSISALDSSHTLERLNVYVNNVPVYGKRGLGLKSQNLKSLKKNIDLALNEGKNVVQVSVLNENGVESIRETFGISCTAKKSKPNLYVLSVGARSYADSSMNLTYSDKDAEDISSTFFQSAGLTKAPYGRVFTKTITNKDVTAGNVKALKSILKESKVDDQVILFFSGHGLLSESMDYYLAMYDVDFSKPEIKGLSYEDFQNIIDSIPARKKLILLDACHSGELDKDEVASVTAKPVEGEKLESKEFATKGKKVIGMKNTNEMMKELFTDLRKESGATVISSSSGKEFSLEGKEWKNGVFTYSLKMGLSSMKADTDKNNEVQVSELREYISVKVKELTNGNQNPTSRQENTEFNVRIW